MKIPFFISLFLFYSIVKGQPNLVPNPSFEDTIPCVANTGPPQMPCSLWFAIGSSDYFNEPYSQYCAWGNLGFSNLFGHQNARTGDAYCGFSPWAGFSANWREYLEIELSAQLIAGKKYCVSFYVSLGDTMEYAVNRIGAYFSIDSVQLSDILPFTIIPQVANPVGNVVTDTASWVLIADTFIATGGEKFITIGNFYNDGNTTTQVVNPTSTQNYSYYYIDDVSVIDCGWSGIQENENAWGVSVYPNPSNGTFTVSSKLPIDKIEITNVLGEIIYQSEIKGMKSEIDLSDKTKGIYFLKLQSGDKTCTEKIIIQ